MKNNLDNYPHYVDSHATWQHKMLIKHYGWDGEGRYLALCNMIAAADNCILPLAKKLQVNVVAADLGLEPGELLEFINFLVNEAELLIEKDGGYTTEIIQEALAIANKVRHYDRQRKQKAAGNPGGPITVIKKAEQEIDNSIRKLAFSIQENEQSKVKETTVNEIKVKENKTGENTTNAARPVNTGRSFLNKKQEKEKPNTPAFTLLFYKPRSPGSQPGATGYGRHGPAK